MYRFLIVVCSLDLKWGRESCLRRDSHGCRGDFIFFHKNARKRRLRSALLLQEKLRNETLWGELAFIAATNSCALNSQIDLKYID